MPLQRRITLLFLLFAIELVVLVGAALYFNRGHLVAPGWRVALALLFLAVGSALVSGLAIKRVVRPLADLANAADRIASGDFTPWFPVPQGDDEVTRLTMAFGTMVVRLRELVDQIEVTRSVGALGAFASRMAHEVRNPLSSVRLNLQRIERGLRDGRARDELGEPVELCLHEVERLEEVVRDALAVGKVQNGRRELFHVSSPVVQTVRLLGAEARSRNVSITVDWAAVDDRIVGNPKLIQGVFLNLLRNAMDAMPDGGAVRISAEVTGAEGAWIAVHVHDDGPGVPPELRDRIFQPYFTTKPDGVGLGLALARATLEAHGGHLQLEQRSELERGADFVVSLPLYSPARATEPRATEPLEAAAI